MSRTRDCSTNPTRRGAIAVALATVALPAVAVAGILAEPDPIFAAIENYRVTIAACETFLHNMSVAHEATRNAAGKLSKLPAEWEDGEAWHLDADYKAAVTFATTTPTMLAGIVAALAFVRGEESRGNSLCDEYTREQLAFSIERAACALAGLPVPTWDTVS